jgi:fructose transport system permease protein
MTSQTELEQAGRSPRQPLRALGARVQRLLHSHPTIGPAVVLVISVIAFMAISPRFAEIRNLSLVLQQATVVGTLAVGQTIIILTAGIDLSVGSIMLISSITTASLAANLGVPAALALVAGFIVSLVCGLINGFLVTRLKLPAFITTLGTASVFLALALFVSSSHSISTNDPLIMLPAVTVPIFGTSLPISALIMLLLYAFAAYVLRFTAFGRHIYAVGGDREASRLAGISIHRVVLGSYAFAAITYAIGGWLQTARLASASPQVGASYALDSITAVVIGGTSLFGGRGSVGGTLIGALIVTVFRNGLSIAGLDTLWQDFAVGVLIIVAVALDQWIRTLRS